MTAGEPIDPGRFGRTVWSGDPPVARRFCSACRSAFQVFCRCRKFGQRRVGWFADMVDAVVVVGLG